MGRAHNLLFFSRKLRENVNQLLIPQMLCEAMLKAKYFACLQVFGFVGTKQGMCDSNQTSEAVVREGSEIPPG